MRGPAAMLLAAVATLSAADARAQLLELGEGDIRYALGGYLRAFSALTYPPLELPGFERPIAQTVNLTRLEHRLTLGERAGLEVHNRVALVQGNQVGAVGVGVTPRPDRSLDLRYGIVETDDVTLDHDLDRALLRLYLGGADVTLGRQAITWGSAQLFTAADLWAPFSPYELDTSQKRGIDAARAIFSPAGTSELELIVADRGSLRDLSGGAKLRLFGARFDGFFGAAKSWEQLVATAGVRTERGAWTFQGEATLPARILEADGGRSPEPGIQLPRATVGATRFRENWITIVEAHFNGAGAASPDDYTARLADPDVQRGETFWLGRYFAGATLAWVPNVEWTVTGGALVNVRDPSVLGLASAEYRLGESSAVTGGWAGGFGRSPELTLIDGLPVLDLRSEFGTYGQSGYVQVALFF
jgi:hypothetical protein